MENISYLLFIFTMYSFLGWCLEELYCYIITKHFKADGFLSGPFKPMYGFAICIIVYITEIAKLNGGVLFLTFLLIPTLVEFISGYLLRRVFNKDYWDYSNNKFNFKGLVCFKFSLYWMILTVLVVFLIQPIISSVYMSFIGVFRFIVPILIIYILLDFIGTIKLLSYNKVMSGK